MLSLAENLFKTEAGLKQTQHWDCLSEISGKHYITLTLTHTNTHCWADRVVTPNTVANGALEKIKELNAQRKTNSACPSEEDS